MYAIITNQHLYTWTVCLIFVCQCCHGNYKQQIQNNSNDWSQTSCGDRSVILKYISKGSNKSEKKRLVMEWAHISDGMDTD